jgi:hypothetical protein
MSVFDPTIQPSESYIEAHLDLSQVAIGDQQFIKDVCAVLLAIRNDISVESVNVKAINDVYHIVATFPPGIVTEIAKSDLDTITDVNPLRISGISIIHDGSRLSIKARACGFAHPITCTDTQLVRVIKKRRWGIL